MSRLKYVMVSVLLGLLAGPLFVLIAILLDISLEKFLPATTFPVVLPIGMSFIIIASIFFFIIRKAEKKIAITAMILLILSFIYSVCVVGDLILIGPGPEQITYMHLLAKLRDEKGRIDPNWTKSEWNFYKPRCYVTFCAKRYGNTSLEVAVFYYGHYGKSAYNPHSVLKCLFTKLFCGITDSKTAYENYKRFLSKSGFLIKNETNNFVAENETVTVYCQLDGDFITVVKVNKNEEYLLNKSFIERS